jgi:N-methylhydantoinase B
LRREVSGGAMTETRTHADIDPITLEVIRYGLISTTNQIDANIKRTAFSPYIYEYNDFAVGVTDIKGRLVAQCTGGMPPFVADSVGTAVRDGLQIYGLERLHFGDVIVCNHAAVQGQHLNNTVMYTPIAENTDGSGKLIGFFAINVHWIDIGGTMNNSHDIFMEGLQLRSVKMWSKGEPIEEVYRIIENNTRLPTELLGDIQAQLAGCLLGRDLIAALVARYGLSTFERAIDIILDQAEASARQHIRNLPDGEYVHETWLDNDGQGDAPIPIKVKVIIKGDEMTVDYTGIADQAKGSINSGYHGGGVTTARVAFRYLVAPDEPANEGLFRPLSLILPPGKILSADPTAPMANYPMPFPTVIDAVIKALEKALPERVTGGHFATHSGFRLFGRRANGRPFNGHDSGHGGWGACATHDGAGPFRTMAHGDTRLIPIELQERLLPFRIDSIALRPDSGGAGTFRGGLGFSKTYRILEDCQLQTNLDRTKHPAWGVLGGKEGRPGQVLVIDEDGGVTPKFKAHGEPLAAGSLVILETGGGGGYGSVEKRDLNAIQRDVDEGYITREGAERDYGVRVDAKGRVTREA